MALFQKLYRLETRQFLPISIEEAWSFFSSPNNLREITPDHMGFMITSKPSKKMYPGMLITYIIAPLFGIKMRWCTEITHVEKNKYFIDEQRFGPYTMWHHQHDFKVVDGGVDMTDTIHYGIPLGVLGQFANFILVKKQLKEIFEYRAHAVEKKWPSKENSSSRNRIEFF